MNTTRRGFIKGSLATAGLASIGVKSEAAAKPSINMAGYNLDRVRALIDGRVQVAGYETRFEVASIGDMNTHVFSGPQAREVSEIGLSPFMLKQMAWIKESLPWFAQEFEETQAAMGENYWPYGIGPNRKALEALFQYSYEQGLAAKKLTVEELFHPSTLEWVEGEK